MDEILKQLGGLLLGSIPTIILFLVLFASYRSLVHVPLTKVLAERRTRTEGASGKARADMAAAEARTAEYEQRVREARAQRFQGAGSAAPAGIRARERRQLLKRGAAGERKGKQAKAPLSRGNRSIASLKQHCRSRPNAWHRKSSAAFCGRLGAALPSRVVANEPQPRKRQAATAGEP